MRDLIEKPNFFSNKPFLRGETVGTSLPSTSSGTSSRNASIPVLMLILDRDNKSHLLRLNRHCHSPFRIIHLRMVFHAFHLDDRESQIYLVCFSTTIKISLGANEKKNTRLRICEG